MEPWGFSFADIRVPVQLWHSRQDRFVPFQHGQWLAERIPGVEAHLTETDGHVTLARGVPEVHAWLFELRTPCLRSTNSRRLSRRIRTQPSNEHDDVAENHGRFRAHGRPGNG